MPDVFTPAKRSEVIAGIQGKGNKDTELRMMAVFWRRRDHGLAAECAAVWEAGFCLSEGATGGVCRWLVALLFGKAMQIGSAWEETLTRGVLARLPEAETCAAAEDERGVLGEEAGEEPGARCHGDGDVASSRERGRLAGVAHLGMRSGA